MVAVIAHKDECKEANNYLLIYIALTMLGSINITALLIKVLCCPFRIVYTSKKNQIQYLNDASKRMNYYWERMRTVKSTMGYVLLGMSILTFVYGSIIIS